MGIARPATCNYCERYHRHYIIVRGQPGRGDEGKDPVGHCQRHEQNLYHHHRGRRADCTHEFGNEVGKAFYDCFCGRMKRDLCIVPRVYQYVTVTSIIIA